MDHDISERVLCYGSQVPVAIDHGGHCRFCCHVEVEGVIEVREGKAFFKQATCEVILAHDGVLRISVVAEEDRVKLSAVLRREPVEAAAKIGAWCFGGIHTCTVSQLEIKEQR